MIQMHIKITISKAIYPALFSAAMLFATSSAFAQVKIGSSPTVINPANNLEVESSSGMKTSIDKTTGKLIYVDGTQGTGKVLTSDPVGLASWEYPLTGSLIMGTGGATVSVPTGTGVNYRFNYSGASITFPKAGSYLVFAKWQMISPVSSYSDPSPHAFINTALSTSSTVHTSTGDFAAEWVYVVVDQQHSTPGFIVNATAGQTLYFWYGTGYYSGSLRLINSYAIGPF